MRLLQAILGETLVLNGVWPTGKQLPARVDAILIDWRCATDGQMDYDLEQLSRRSSLFRTRRVTVLGKLPEPTLRYHRIIKCEVLELSDSDDLEIIMCLVTGFTKVELRGAIAMATVESVLLFPGLDWVDVTHLAMAFDLATAIDVLLGSKKPTNCVFSVAGFDLVKDALLTESGRKLSHRVLIMDDTEEEFFSYHIIRDSINVRFTDGHFIDDFLKLVLRVNYIRVFEFERIDGSGEFANTFKNYQRSADRTSADSLNGATEFCDHGDVYYITRMCLKKYENDCVR